MDGEVERFEYAESADAPFVPSWTGWEQAPDVDRQPDGAPAWNRPVSSPAEKPQAPELERQVAEVRRSSFEAGRAHGVEEGRREQAAAVEAARMERVRQAARLLEQFRTERERYFHEVEAEVVRLALAVAARILRREAVSDPLLLLGAVRAALGQLAGASTVRLRVPAAELDLWVEALALLPHFPVKPQVAAGEKMALGECLLESDLGSADLGVHAQLAEIERVLLGDAELRETQLLQPEATALAAESAA